MARKQAKLLFPQMKHEEIVEILGAKIQTTNKLVYEWSPLKTTNVLKELKIIAALPCSTDLHEHLASTKVIPKIGFATHLNKIPKNDLKLIQSQITQLLWKNRPMWRSRFLLLGLLSKPHRTEPFIARAYNTILDCVDFLKNTTPDHRRMWQLQFDSSDLAPNS